jgi:lipid-binding SYLF domain-containing protein
MRTFTISTLVMVVACIVVIGAPASSLADSSKSELVTSARKALHDLCKTTPAAAALQEKAAGVLVFPKIFKGGFIIAGQYGDGVLFRHGKPSGYYNSVSASFGLQAGAQRFGYALFFMTEDDLKYLDSSSGWEVGALPSLTVVDVGVARSLSTTTLQKGMYAFFFGQMGLMGGLSLQGTKITQIHPDDD